MQATINHIFVKVESEFNDQIDTKSGVKLFLTTQRFAEDDDNTNANHKPTMLRRNYGTVAGVPGKLTKDEKVLQIEPGFPSPTRYIPNETIEEHQGRNSYLDSWSSIAIFVHEWKTCADFEMEVQEGDKIYFHHNTIIDQNQVSYVGDKIYKLAYNHALCVIRNSKIIPVAGTILVEPIWEDGVEDLGNGKKGKLSECGLVTELHEKPKHLEGIVRFVCSPMKGEETELVSGDKIIYIEHADWELEIEGKKYFIMKYWDVLAKIEISI